MLAAVHGAEVVARRVGEPCGSLVPAVAVIGVALIVTLVVAGGPGTATLARDTAFAAVMTTCNGILGLSLLVGALRHRVPVFNAGGRRGPGEGRVPAIEAGVQALGSRRPSSAPSPSSRAGRLHREVGCTSCCSRRSCSWLPALIPA